MPTDINSIVAETVENVSQSFTEEGKDKAGETLQSEIEQARELLTPAEYNEFLRGLVTSSNAQEFLPALAADWAFYGANDVRQGRNNFDGIDRDGNYGLSVAELSAARESSNDEYADLMIDVLLDSYKTLKDVDNPAILEAAPDDISSTDLTNYITRIDSEFAERTAQVAAAEEQQAAETASRELMKPLFNGTPALFDILDTQTDTNPDQLIGLNDLEAFTDRARALYPADSFPEDGLYSRANYELACYLETNWNNPDVVRLRQNGNLITTDTLIAAGGFEPGTDLKAAFATAPAESHVEGAEEEDNDEAGADVVPPLTSNELLAINRALQDATFVDKIDGNSSGNITLATLMAAETSDIGAIQGGGHSAFTAEQNRVRRLLVQHFDELAANGIIKAELNDDVAGQPTQEELHAGIQNEINRLTTVEAGGSYWSVAARLLDIDLAAIDTNPLTREQVEQINHLVDVLRSNYQSQYGVVGLHPGREIPLAVNDELLKDPVMASIVNRIGQSWTQAWLKKQQRIDHNR